jgi:hypothetical protein
MIGLHSDSCVDSVDIIPSNFRSMHSQKTRAIKLRRYLSAAGKGYKAMH